MIAIASQKTENKLVDTQAMKSVSYFLQICSITWQDYRGITLSPDDVNDTISIMIHAQKIISESFEQKGDGKAESTNRDPLEKRKDFK